MFLAHRPSSRDIDRFLDGSRTLPLSYGPPGLAQTGAAGFRVDEDTAAVGSGNAAFARAVEAIVAVAIRHFGFWSLNGCRVLYQTGDGGASTFGFADGTLTNHAECGEEIFEVRLDPDTGDVGSRIRAVSGESR